MAIIIARPQRPPLEFPEPDDARDFRDPLGFRLGGPIRIPFLVNFGVTTQIGKIWLGTFGFFSVLFFAMAAGCFIWGGITQMRGNVVEYVRHFAHVQLLPPDGIGIAPSMANGGWWQIVLTFLALAVICWAMRCYERLTRYEWRPFLLIAWLSAILLTATIWVFRPLLMGTWAEAPALGLNADLDWAQNFSVLWGNLYYDPFHQLSIFFLLGSTLLWGMHGGTILATASEASHLEDAEIKDMHSGSHKAMLFWRWTIGFNANPKTIHDWLVWFAVGVVLAGAIGIIITGTIVPNWYVWGVQHGTVKKYGPMTIDAENTKPLQAFPVKVKLMLPLAPAAKAGP